MQGPASASAQPTSYVVVDDQQPGTSRQMIFNPPSVAASQQEETQHITSGYPVPLERFPVYYITSRLSPVSSSTHHEQSRPPSQSSQQSQPKSAD